MQRHRAAAEMLAGLALAAALALPPVRELLESSMRLHMLAQAPLLALGGWLLAAGLPSRAREFLGRWNAYGITGLASVAAAMSLLMIPRLLDLVLVDWRIEALKWVVLVACGGAVRLSWRRAGWLVQGFFLGNVLPMLAVAGQLYQDSPLRLCNAYQLQDQVALGSALVASALGGGLVWTACLFAAVARRDAHSLPA